MIFKVLFLSAAGYLAYRYIGRSNKKAKELNQASSAIRGTVEILPPEPASESLKPARSSGMISSPAAEDLGRKY
ncbi:MAG: hypothetical protein SGI92_30905 [Bryobacteraceae bacterium]|nr:hypothetical protein [Bryobacteraceae bacterium]